MDIYPLLRSAFAVLVVFTHLKSTDWRPMACNSRRAYVSSSVCSPSRYALLTGRFAGRCRAPSFLRLHPPGTMTRVENNTELESELPNLANVLRNAGYRTGFVGKCHLVDHDTLLHRASWSENGLQAYSKSDDPADPAVTKKMQFNHEHLCQRLKDFGFDWAGGVYAANLKELFNDKANVHNIDWTNQAALTFLDQERDGPFFLYYATTLPHGPEPWIEEAGHYVKGIDSDPCITGEGFRPDLMRPRTSETRLGEAVGRSRRCDGEISLVDLA